MISLAMLPALTLILLFRGVLAFPITKDGGHGEQRFDYLLFPTHLLMVITSFHSSADTISISFPPSQAHQHPLPSLSSPSSSIMHLLNYSQLPSRSACVGHFSGSRNQEILVARGGTRIELLRTDASTGKLESVVEAEVFGTIRSLPAFKLTGATKGESFEARELEEGRQMTYCQ